MNFNKIKKLSTSKQALPCRMAKATWMAGATWITMSMISYQNQLDGLY